MTEDGKTVGTLKLIHLISTAWFMLCVGVLLLVKLREEGWNWWVISSLSLPTALVIILLTTVYTFARGSKEQYSNMEHPLTVSVYYMGFYVSAPLLGSLAGLSAIQGAGVEAAVINVAMGSLAATFVTWILVDTSLSFIELLFPASKQHRNSRLAALKQQKELEQAAKEQLLNDILAKEAVERRKWESVLTIEAGRLASLLSQPQDRDPYPLEAEARGIGAKAWRLGGLNCMQQLRDMTVDMAKTKDQEPGLGEYISGLWDGIGNWRNPGLC